MKVEIEDIRAWVDGELDKHQADRVANAVASSERLQQTADKMCASRLPYSDAYEQTQTPDVPESLRLNIEALQNRPVQNLPLQNLSLENPSLQNPATENQDAPDLPAIAANNSFFKIGGIAASVAMAALIGYLGYVAGASTTTRATPDVSASVGSPGFAQTVAAYQKFYVRETLMGTVAPSPSKVAKRLENQTGMQVIIPELEGYEFMRAQRLTYDGELLLQLVYLGAEGGPLALCYTMALDSEAGSDLTEATTLQKYHGLNTAEWRHNGHRFVLVADAVEKKLIKLSHATRQQWNI